jgi:hypothetical protein
MSALHLVLVYELVSLAELLRRLNTHGAKSTVASGAGLARGEIGARLFGEWRRGCAKRLDEARAGSISHGHRRSAPTATLEAIRPFE